MTDQYILQLIEMGIAGLFILFLIYCIYKLWKAKEMRDEYIRKQNVTTSTIVGKMSNVMQTLLTRTDTLPVQVKKELASDMVELKSGIEDIKQSIQGIKS